jgi:hypothetical protein
MKMHNVIGAAQADRRRNLCKRRAGRGSWHAHPQVQE